MNNALNNVISEKLNKMTGKINANSKNTKKSNFCNS